jgi:hypothetical protein
MARPSARFRLCVPVAVSTNHRAGQPGEGAAGASYAETRDLRQPPATSRRAFSPARGCPTSRRDSDRSSGAAQLDPEHVRLKCSQGRPGERVWARAASVLEAATSAVGRPQRDLTRGGPGTAMGCPAPLGEQLRHAQPPIGLHPLGGGHDDRAGLEVRGERRHRRPDELGRDRQHHQPASPNGLGGVAGGGTPRGQREPGQIAPVLARLANLLKPASGPERTAHRTTRWMASAVPAARAQDGDRGRGERGAHAALTRWPSRLSVPARSRWMFC